MYIKSVPLAPVSWNGQKGCRESYGKYNVEAIIRETREVQTAPWP